MTSEVLLQLLLNVPSSANGAIFPNLRSLKCEFWNTTFKTSHLVAFLSSKLAELDLFISDMRTNSEACQLLRLIGNKVQGSLHALTIHYECKHNIDFHRTLATFLQQQPNLSSIRIIRTNPPDIVLHALNGCYSLRSVTVAVTFWEQAYRLWFLTALAESCPHIEVLNLNLELLRQHYDPRVRPLHPSVISPLLHMGDLVEVRLQFRLELLSDVDTVSAMGSAWPRLEILHISLPMALLPALAAAFQATLRRLSVTIIFDSDGGDLPPANEITGSLPRLQYLEVNHSCLPQERVAEVAEFLAVCCPQATIVRRLGAVNQGGSFVAGSPWALVIEMMQAIRRVREADRSRAS